MSTGGIHPFLAFVTDDKDIGTLSEFSKEKGWPDSGILKGNINDAVEYLKNNKSPPLLLVEVSSQAEAPKELDKLAETCDPDSKVIVIGSVNEYSFFCWLMDLGISSYLLKPLTKESITQAVNKAVAPPSSSGESAKAPGKLIAVIGARGGVGATSLCINLAGIIAENAQKPVALVDLDAKQGTVALDLDLEPSRGLREALEKPERIDSLFLERVMAKPHKNLSILSSEENIQESFKIHEGAAESLLKQLQESYSVIIVDMSRYLDSFSKHFLQVADHVLLACELSLLSLRDTLRLQDLMRESLKRREPPIVVAMRTGMAPKQEVLKADFEKGIDNKVAYAVPYAPDVFMPIDINIPAIKAKANAAVRPLFDLAGDLIPEAKQEATKKKGKEKPEKKGGLLGKK